MTHTLDLAKHAQTRIGGQSRFSGRPRNGCRYQNFPFNQVRPIHACNPKTICQPYKRFWLKRDHRKISQSKACYAAIRAKNRRVLTKQKGFTLIEATVVLFIIGLLMLLILPNLTQ